MLVNSVVTSSLALFAAANSVANKAPFCLCFVSAQDWTIQFTVCVCVRTRYHDDVMMM
jgi:hypothetical protein